MQLMLEKMKNITKKLKNKDILLKKAEVQTKEAEELAKQSSQIDLARVETAAQPYLHPFSTTQYEDEDMYMGDNKADKLKENRICRKVT